MQGSRGRPPLGGLLVGATLLLAACGHERLDGAGAEGLNAYPTNYKADILGGMHVYVNDPTGIRDAAISEPMLKSIGGTQRYLVCLRFNGKKSATQYAGTKEIVAVFLAGRFDRFVETAREQCAEVSYVGFPELEKLSR